MKIINKLREKLENVEENISMAQYSTFRLGGPAKYFYIAKSSDEMIKAVQAAHELDLEIFILAGGSNLLIADAGFDGLVIKAENKKIELKNETTIFAEGGASWNDFVMFTADNSLTGVEWGAGIPGTVGGAIRGNAGAFGRSISEVIDSVNVIKISDEVKTITMSDAECKFDYRESIFKQDKNLIILSAELSLQTGNREEIKNIIKEKIAYRKNTQPCEPSAGCTFKNIIVTDEIRAKIKKINPEGEQKIKSDPGKGGTSKIGAGWFIDQAGLKGYQIGGVKVSDQHANFIVKVDESARTDHVIQLISYIKQQVRDNLGIQLHEEVQYVGF
ncbi:MAG: UDP-N-acetylmuramate dehydrogenase [bacterium]|nr:UDP-N-acetylmuramate dehydrogenase [bacterium]